MVCLEGAGRSLEWYPRSPSSAVLPFFGEGSPTKVDCRKKGTLILTSLLEDLVSIGGKSHQNRVPMRVDSLERVFLWLHSGDTHTHM